MTDPRRKIDTGPPRQPPDFADPVAFDPRGDPRFVDGSRGVGGAALALMLIVLGVLAFALFGGDGDQQATQQARMPAENTDSLTTGATTSNGAEQAIPPIELKDPSVPVQPTPGD